MEKEQEVVTVIVLDESEEDEAAIQIRTPLDETEMVANQVAGQDETEEASVSREEDEDFVPWPLRPRKQPIPSSSTKAAPVLKEADSFKAIDEDELLADLFPTENGNRHKNPKKRRGEAEGDEGSLPEAKEPARKLRKTRSNPKIKPLKIIGGGAKKTKSQSNDEPTELQDGERLGHEESPELDDSVEDEEGEECPVCGRTFGADQLQAHVEAEINKIESAAQRGERSSGTGGDQSAQLPRPRPRPRPPALQPQRPVTRSQSRAGAGAGGGGQQARDVEVVVLDDDDDDNAEPEEIDSSGDGDKAECPFCQRLFRRGVELEQHVYQEMTARESAGGTSTSTSTSTERERGKRTATRLPLVPPQNPRKLPSSFGSVSSSSAGTLSPFVNKRNSSSPASTSTSSSSSPLVPDSQQSTSTSSSTASRTAADEDDPDADTYDDVTFNFRPIWASQGLPYDYQNQFNKQKKKRGGRKAIYAEEQAEVELGEEGEELEVMEEEAPKRGRGKSKASSASSGGSTRKSGWRGGRRGGGGWGRGRARRGR